LDSLGTDALTDVVRVPRLAFTISAMVDAETALGHRSFQFLMTSWSRSTLCSSSATFATLTTAGP
jgi:hypothetical protein